MLALRAARAPGAAVELLYHRQPGRQWHKLARKEAAELLAPAVVLWCPAVGMLSTAQKPSRQAGDRLHSVAVFSSPLY